MRSRGGVWPVRVWSTRAGIAARGALALDAGLRRHGPHQDFRRTQRDIARAADVAWTMATTQDLRYPTTTGPRPNALARSRQRFLDRIAWTATSRPSVAAAQLDVYTLSAPPTRLLTPHVLLSVMLGPRRPARADPPLTTDEQTVRDQ